MYLSGLFFSFIMFCASTVLKNTFSALLFHKGKFVLGVDIEASVAAGLLFKLSL